MHERILEGLAGGYDKLNRLSEAKAMYEQVNSCRTPNTFSVLAYSISRVAALGRFRFHRSSIAFVMKAATRPIQDAYNRAVKKGKSSRRFFSPL